MMSNPRFFRSLLRNRFLLASASCLTLGVLCSSAAMAQEKNQPPPEKNPATNVGTVAVPLSPTRVNAGPVSTPLTRSIDAYRKGDLVTALKEIDGGLDDSGKQPDLLNWYGYVLLRMNRADEAIPQLEKVISQGAETPEVDVNLGTALLLKVQASPEDITRAVSLLEKGVAAKPITPDTAPADQEVALTALANLGHAYLRAGKPVEAAATYQKVLEKQPDNEGLYRMRGYALIRAGQTADALTALHQATTLNAQDGEAWGLIGSIELQQGNRDAALTALETARKIGPPNPTTLANLGLLYSQMNRLDESAVAYAASAELAENLTPPNFTPRINQGIAYARLNKWREAAETYETVLGKDPENYDALINLGSVRFQQGRLDEAIARFTAATAQKPTLALGWANLGSALDASHNYRESAGAWDHAVKIEPLNKTYAASYRAALTRAGQTNLVIEASRAEARSTGATAPLNDLGSALVRKADQSPRAVERQKDLVQALSVFKEAVKREPQSPRAWNNLGVVYEKRGQINEAILAYKTALHIDPAFAEARLNLGRFIPASALPALPKSKKVTKTTAVPKSSVTGGVANRP